MRPNFLRTIKLDGTFAAWRSAARRLTAMNVHPSDVHFEDAHTAPALFADDFDVSPPLDDLGKNAVKLRVPAAFLPLAQTVACHRDPARWHLLYRLLFRLTHSEPHLLNLSIDDDVHPFLMMEKAVRRDAHKTKAFVRFRQLIDPHGGQRFVAFHRPDHYILPLVTDFFVDRFHSMHWSLLTPDACICWDGHALTEAPGVGPSAAPQGDDIEAFWKTYYSAIFNPARIRLHAMTKEMPKKHWMTLPEAEIIDDLVKKSPARVNAMFAANAAPARSAADFLPPRIGEGADTSEAPFSLPQLRAAAVTCQGCDLCHTATHTVFGEGPPTARIMLIGEQPGDNEDLEARPFVGPAGQVLNEALAAAGLPRESLYLTNAVKHFKWTPDPRGKRRIHSKPGWREVSACRPWLLEEIKTLRPALIVTLGVTAAQSLLGPDFRLTPHRGIARTDTPFAPILLPTLHPAALLRIPDPALRAQQTQHFHTDLKLAATL